MTLSEGICLTLAFAISGLGFGVTALHRPTSGLDAIHVLSAPEIFSFEAPPESPKAELALKRDPMLIWELPKIGVHICGSL